jgi:hypothetical protein
LGSLAWSSTNGTGRSATQQESQSVKIKKNMATDNSITPMIERVVRGSYDPQVQLTDGRSVKLTDLMIEMYNQQGGGLAGVKDSFVLTNDRTIVNSADTFMYSPVNPPESLIRIPTLSELGYPEQGYELQVSVTAYMRSINNQEVITEVKLVSADGNDIAGTLVQNSNIRPEYDWPVQLNKVTIAGGTLVAVDFHRQPSTAADDIRLYSSSLLVQVVKIAV